MRLFIIRHAESANNALAGSVDYDSYMAERSDDPPLSELGERQAERLAEHVASDAHPESRHEDRPVQPYSGYGFTHLYCSPMLRSMQTAEPVGRALGIRPEVWMGIHEHGGIFLGNPRSGVDLTVRPGLTRSQALDRFPSYTIPEGMQEDGWWKREYEDMPACYARAIRVARVLQRRAADNRKSGIHEAVAMVSHGAFIDGLLKAFLNQIPDDRLFYQHYNTAITRLDFMADDTILLRYLNRTQHLLPELFSV